jgi:NDP-sugar pyrophosphorylase family protein
MLINDKVAVLLLCGGRGTRLGPDFKNTNKSLIRIKNKTLISSNIDYLLKQKFENIFVLTGHAYKKVEQEVKSKFKRKVILNFTGLNTSIAMRIEKTLKFLDKFQYVLIMNGDSIYKFNLNKIFYQTCKKNIDCSLVCTSKIIKYGFVELNKKKMVKSFVKNIEFYNFFNKRSYLFYSGLCFVNIKLLKKNLKGIKKNFEINLFNKLIKKNKTEVFFDKAEFRDFNNIDDIMDLKNKRLKSI